MIERRTKIGMQDGAAGLRAAVVLCGALLALTLLLAPASAPAADFGFEAFDGAVSNEDGSLATQAGGHPWSASVSFDLNSEEGSNGVFGPAGGVFLANLDVDLPPGLIGAAADIPRCERSDQLLAAGTYDLENSCPLSSMVGLATLRLGVFFEVHTGKVPVFNMEPPPGVPAEFAIANGVYPLFLQPVLRSDSDHGITMRARSINQGVNVIGSTVTLWGVPADASHDDERCLLLEETGTPCIGEPGTASGPNSVDSGVHRQPLVRNPTRCTAPGVGLTTSARAQSYPVPPGQGEDARLSAEASFVSHEPPGYPEPPEAWGPEAGPSNCEIVPFAPQISAKPSSNEADAPSGLTVDVHIPQEGLDNPTGIAPSDLKKVVVTLPEGVTVNPSSANGLDACSPAQIGFIGGGFPDPNPIRFDKAAPQCPDSSKIGAVRIGTPLLDRDLTGSVYLAQQQSNPFSSLLAIYIAVDDPASGTVVKLPGRIDIAAGSGQVTATFDNNPQVPFEDLHVQIFDGPRASLRTPEACGTYATTATFTPWSGTAPVVRESSFQITRGPGGQPCPSGAFAPQFSAGSANPVAGAYSPFNLRISRDDGTQQLSTVAVRMPPGVLAKLAGIPYCPEAALAAIPTAEGTGAAQLATPSCPAASQVGTVSVGAGAGPSPFYVDTGRAYLAGPYKGAPISLAIVTPALAGPFDLGNVVVRAALQVNPETTQVTAVSDPLPTALSGIPLDLRDVRVNIDRSDFTRNPTSCDPMQVESEIGSSSGRLATPASRFQVGSCAALGFRPRIGLQLFGGIKRGEYQGLRAVVRARPGDADIGRTVVRMPRSAFLAQEHIRTVCTRVQFAADACPSGAVYGRAVAYSPLLDLPLRGNVYLRSSDNKLPDLVADLRGPAYQPVKVELVGRTDSVKGALRNTFDTVPDAPVSYFRLQLFGGKKSLIVNSRDICAKRFRAGVRMDAHNGRRTILRPALHNKRCKAYKRKLRKAKRRAHRSRLPAAKRVDPGLSPTPAP